MKKNAFFLLLFSVSLFGQEVSIVVLGTAQDAGAPQIACEKECCRDLWGMQKTEAVVALGLIDRSEKVHFLFEATPNISQQLNLLGDQAEPNSNFKGVFLTHAHIGHYSGLMYFGKEALSAKNIPVYALPKMTEFLQTNGPWEQLIAEKNIQINTIYADRSIRLTAQIKVTPLVVPHRDEYSETAGYIIQGPNKSVLFIPDIDKWERWKIPIETVLRKVDYAFLDATFFDGKELPGRDMTSIPHPFVKESMQRFDVLAEEEKNKIHFIHFNHTNPLLKNTSGESIIVEEKGYHIARTGMKINL